MQKRWWDRWRNLFIRRNPFTHSVIVKWSLLFSSTAAKCVLWYFKGTKFKGKCWVSVWNKINIITASISIHRFNSIQYSYVDDVALWHSACVMDMMQMVDNAAYGSSAQLHGLITLYWGEKLLSDNCKVIMQYLWYSINLCLFIIIYALFESLPVHTHMIRTCPFHSLPG